MGQEEGEVIIPKGSIMAMCIVLGESEGECVLRDYYINNDKLMYDSFFFPCFYFIYKGELGSSLAEMQERILERERKVEEIRESMDLCKVGPE